MSRALNGEETRRIVRALWKWINILHESAYDLSHGGDRMTELTEKHGTSNLTREQVGEFRSALFQFPTNAHMIAISLRQVNEHVTELSSSALWQGELAKRGKEFQSIFRSDDIRDLRDVLEHGAKYLAGKKGRKLNLIKDSSGDWPSFTALNNKLVNIGVFGRNYHVEPAITAAFEFADALPKSKDV